MSITNL